MDRIEKMNRIVSETMEDDMDRIEKVNKIVDAIMEILPREPGHRFWCNGEEILVDTEDGAEDLADFFDHLYGERTVSTGYYDPEEDKRNNEVDKYTGYYYVNFV